MVMATTCGFLQLCFLKKTQPNSSPIYPSRPPNFSIPSRRSLSFSSSATRPSSSFPVSATSEKPVSWVEDGNSIDSIINPALHHANVMFFRSAYNVQVMVDEGEPEEALLRRFRREVSKAGVIQECKRRRFFENKKEERKRKAREAGRRGRRRRSGGPRIPFSSGSSDAAASKKSGEDDDNWDMPEGDLPY
ncbi:PREDICTED: uncharacterized protein LOC104594134 [Nelumbo nucifera]|uniref:Uncharacterized protein LOC104594134 n=1 Tax=Nelumbo nucifera TaxID=4432 RepID=A0A1U7ZLJ4_NELNU|nr:PREDICTED: uncharacterized protein LOC104594134 [Nelumbo nucifera]